MNGLTYKEAIRVAFEKLRDAGIDNPRAEARRLMCWSSNMSPAQLIAAETDIVEFSHQSTWQMAVRHRLARRPFAHLSGWTEFYGLYLRVDCRALIPRCDSESVVELALEYLPEKKQMKIADLGTGTGCLLLAILSQRQSAQGEGIDLSQDAIHLALDNGEETGLQGRAIFSHKGWSEWTGWATTDLIISNPPYIASSVIPTLAPEVRDHDPMDALDGGADGLNAYREIITLARGMKPGAHLVLEIGFDQKTAVTALLEAAEFSHIIHRKDLGGHDRVIAAAAP